MRRLDLEALLSNYAVPYVPHGEWLNLTCPQCGKKKLGWSGTVFYCFKCGKLPFRKTLEELTGVPFDKLDVSYKISVKDSEKNSAKPLQLPCGMDSTLNDNAREYLSSRGFDVDELIAKYAINSIGWKSTSLLKQRVFIPHIIDGRLVSWQARAYAGQEPRYIICEHDREKVPCRSSLYNIDNVKEGRCVVVEGITDVWKLGDGAVCTFGKDYTLDQLIELSKMKEVHILFDSEVDAQKKARQLHDDLDALGIFSTVNEVTSAKDPGSLTQREGRLVMKELLG